MATAIITGGSSGLGLLFADRLASEGNDLVLIARDKNKLHKVASQLADIYGVKVDAINTDLSEPNNIEKLVKLIGQTKDLAYMVNNAGFATHITADDNSRKAHEIHHNALVVMGLNTAIFSAAAASVMKKQNSGHIINISSTASWTFQGSYSAIKGYVRIYTESLAIQLEGTNVTATAVCPAWMHTNFHAAAGLGEPAIPEWLYVNPSQVVDQALRGVRQGKRLVVPTLRWRFIIWCVIHGPAGLGRAISRKYMKTKNYHKNQKGKNHE